MSYLLPHTILHAAARFPDREAFTCGAKTLSFSQMADRINQLANAIHQIGIRKSDRIGIFLHRSLETAIAIHGIMQAGAVYVPLDPKAPPQRNRHIIADSGIEILISHPTQRRQVKKMLEEGLTLNAIIGIEDVEGARSLSWEKLEQQSTHFTRPFSLLEKDLAYIMYTSGSTGQPKGIMHTHASGLSYARLSAELYQLNESDRLGSHAPIFFDISTLAFFTAPLVGASVVIIPDAYTVMPASLIQLAAREKLTVWYSVPLALIQMLQTGLLEEKNLRSLRWVLYGGEPFPPKYLRQLMALWPQATFCNVYGPAEVNQCTYYHLPGPPKGDDPVPLGRVWDNTEWLIMDEEGQVAEGSGSGELLIRSATMMQGYWRQESLTARAFYRRVNHAGLEEIFYRTGDLVHMDEQGVLHFLGRKDHQVKIRGYRVELDAVEAALVTHPALSEAAVFTVRENEEKLSIAAAVILREQQSIAPADLVAFLKHKLPAYAIPEQISIVTSFPRTGSGKVKRSALKEQLKNA